MSHRFDSHHHRTRQSQYNPDKHHRRSIRLKGYAYAQAGAYFITICTQNREHVFGAIVNHKMVLNKYGTIVLTEWLNTMEKRPHIILDEFVIMPDHFHGIVTIGGIATDR